MFKRALSTVLCLIMLCMTIPMVVVGATDGSGEITAEFLFFECDGLETTIIPQGEATGVARLANNSDVHGVVFAKTVAYNTSGAVLASTDQVLWNVSANTTGEYRTCAISVQNMINLSHVELSVWTEENGKQNILGGLDALTAGLTCEGHRDGAGRKSSFCRKNQCA